MNNSVKLDIDVNQFPSLTWNHLNINRSHFEGELFSARLASCEKVFTLPSQISYEAKKISQVSETKNLVTGLGQAFDAALDQASEKLNGPLNVFTVKKNDKVNENCKIVFELKDGEKSFSDIYILAEENSKSTFIFDYTSEKDAEGLFGLRVRLMAFENAEVHVVTLNRLGKNYMSFNGSSSLVMDNAKVTFTQLELGGKENYNGLKSLLSGYQAKYEGQHAYIVGENSKLDMNQIVLHKGRASECKFFVDGVLMNNAKKTWRGTIDFKHGAIDAKGDEQEDVLLLSPDVTNKSLPVILCDEEAVEGRHGCSISKLNMENLFYMQSRGLDYKSARELLLKAKVRKVLHHIDDEDLSKEVEEFTDRMLLEA